MTGNETSELRRDDDQVAGPAQTSSATLAAGLLSPRETEIARLASHGLSNKEIAQTLEISHWTVSTHIRRIYDKLGIHRRAALATYTARFLSQSRPS